MNRSASSRPGSPIRRLNALAATGLVLLAIGCSSAPIPNRDPVGQPFPAVNARVILLDPEGRVSWFADRGFSAGLMLELDERARDLLAATSPTASDALGS